MLPFFYRSNMSNMNLSTWISMIYILGAVYADSPVTQPNEVPSPMLFAPQNHTAPVKPPQAKRDDSLSAIFILTAPAVMTFALILYLAIQAKRKSDTPAQPDLELEVKSEVVPSNAPSAS